MKKSGVIVLGITTFWLSLMPQAQAGSDSPPVQFQFMLECKTAMTNRSKCGYSEFIHPCPLKERVYKRKLTDWGGSWSWTDINCDGTGQGDSGSLVAHTEEYCDPVTCIPVCTNWSGSFTNFDWNTVSHQYVSSSTSATMTNCNEWDGPATGASCEGCTGTQTNTLTISALTNYCVVDSGSECSTYHCESSSWLVYTLTDEFTTEELLSTNGLNYPDGDWASGSPEPAAFAAIGTLQQIAEVQKMKYRFKVIAPADAHFEFDYYEHFLVDGSTNEVITTNTISGIGTGSWAYYPTNGPVEIAPPYTNSVDGSCTNIIGARKWITLGCGGLGSPCSGCSSAPGSFSVGNQDYGLYASVNLGRDSFGQGSGALIVAGAAPQTKLVTPAGLEFFGSLGGLELIRSQDGSLRQAKSGQLLANIVTNSTTSYTIECYSPNQVGGKDQNGLYTTSGSPFSTATIAQGSSTNEILVTTVNGVTSTYDYTWSAADHGWTLTSGGGLRRETSSWNSTALVRTNTIKNSGNQIVYQEAQYFQNLASWGNVMIRRVVGPEGPALTTQWSYYDNAQTDGTNYGKLKRVIQPSGSWTTYQYATNGWLTKEVSQFLNAPTNAADNQCRVVLYDYTPVVTNCACELRTEQLLGQEIARQYTLNYGSEIRTIQCQTPGTTNLNAADNLVTITRNYYDGSFVGKVKSITNPDGTVQLYSYDTNDTQMTTTVLSGQPDASGTNIVDGTQTLTVTGPAGEMVSSRVVDFASGLTTACDTYAYSDDLHRSYTVTHLDGTSESVQYACCGIDTTTDRDGSVTQYSYDALKRQAASTRNGITTSNILDAAGNVLATVRIGTDSSQIINRLAAYDVAGRLSSETNALGGGTSYTQSFDAAGQTVKTSTYPDAGTRIETYYQDGSLQGLAGTAAYSVRYEYGIESEGGVQRPYTKQIKRDASANDTGEWTKSYTDLLGRTYKTLLADGASNRSFYNNQGQLWKQVDPDGVTTLYQYNPKGEAEYTAVDMNTNGVIDFVGGDRITRRVSDVLSDNGANVRRTRTFVWTTDNADSPLCLSTDEVSADGLHTWRTASGLTTETITSYLGNGQRQTMSYAPDGSYTVTTWQSGQPASVVRYDSNGSQLAATTYGYDAHGRQNQVTDARNGATTRTYNNADLVASLTTPAPDGEQPAQTTTTYYNKMLQVTNTVQPDNTSLFTEYFPTGSLKKQYGSRQYPVEYTYDYAGRMKTMKTWSNYAGNQSATTTWNYDSARGWLTSKTYDGGAAGPVYGYTPAGRLRTRLWARNITTTYAYNNAGDLSGVTYSDSTPAVGYAYDRRGRQTTVTLAGTTTSRTFDDGDNLLTEFYSGGPLAGLSVTSGLDAYLRRTSLSLDYQQSTLQTINYAYDAASRLQTVTDNTGATPYSANYTYLDNSPLVGQIDFAANGANVMSSIKQYDYLNRLTQVASVDAQQSTINSYGYQLNAASQRTAITNTDNCRWVYQYDSLGQVISGRKYWADGTPVAGQQFQYGFDDIGNRKTAASGGDQSGANLRYQNYTANNLNQYTQRTVPGYAAMLGSANSNATVTLWSADGSYAPASRKGEYFRAELPVNNSTGAVCLTLTNLAVLNDGTNPDIVAAAVGNGFLPTTPETFGYDVDANMTNDGRWVLTWDAENRLTKVESKTSAPSASKRRLVLTYDGQGRRIEKIVSAWNGSAYIPQSTNRFAYDGGNLIAEVNILNSAIRTYMLGLDLSGSLQGAGGVGGMLAVRDQATINSQPSTHFVSYDGNGNVAALVNANDGSVPAQYEYGPFGELLRATGPMAKANPFRFSTKFQDDETDLVYYGYRYYSASIGGWLSQDPAQDTESPNTYSFCSCSPIENVDPLGDRVLTYEVITQLIPDSRPAMARLLSDTKGHWRVEHFDSSSLSTELLTCLFWLESKFNTTANAGWPANGYGLGQMTQIGARGIDEYVKAAAYYPASKDAAIARDVGRGMADAFKGATPSVNLAHSEDAGAQIGVAIYALSIKVRKNGGDIAKGLTAYGPPQASTSQYTDVVLHCEKCLKNSGLKDKNGVPVPPGTQKGNENSCPNCLQAADMERAAAYRK